MSITWAQYMQVMRAQDELERMRLLAAFALGVSPERVDAMPASDVLDAVRRAAEMITPPDPTRAQSEPPAGSP